VPNNRTLSGGGKFNPKKIKGLALWLDGADTSRMYTSDAGAVVIPPGWSPDQVSTQIAGWWAADSAPLGMIYQDGSGNVEAVDDLSMAGSNAVQISPGARPQLIENALNGKPVFRFNGSAGLTGGFGYDALGPNRTVFAVCKISAGLTNQRVFSVSSSVGGADFATGQSIPVLANAGSLTQLSSYGSLASRSPVGDFSQFAVFTNTTTGGSITNYSNGLAGATESVATTIDGDLFGIGCAAQDQTAKFTGDIAEIIAYSGLCNATERAMVEKWLADKWNISGVHRSAAQEIAPIVSPLELGGCVGWWDAGDPATITRDNATLLVSQWNDKSGFGRNLTQSDSARRPIYEGDSIEWPSVENGCQLDYLTAFAHQTVIVVCRYGSGFSTGFGGAQGLISSSSALGLLLTGTTWYGAHPFATSFNNVRINGAAAIRVDGQTALPMPLRILTCTRDTAATQGLIIGGERFYTNRGWSGPICEVIAFDRALTTTDALRVENYLQKKWGTPAVPAPTPSIGAWLDKSGNNRHAVQATALYRPVVQTSAIASRTALKFDGSNDWLATANISSAFPSAATAFVVCYPSTSSAVNWAAFSIGSNHWDVYSGSVTYAGIFRYQRINGITTSIKYNAGEPLILRYRSSSASWSQFVNGLSSVEATGSYAAGSGNYSPATGNPGLGYTIGSDLSGGTINGPFKDYICEVLLYNSSLSDADCKRVERQLAAKWSASLRPSVSNADAQDWVRRVYLSGGTVSPATAAAVNQFCNSITDSGIREKFYRLNLFAGSFQGAFVPLYRTWKVYAGRNLLSSGDNFAASAWSKLGVTVSQSTSERPFDGPYAYAITAIAGAGVTPYVVNTANNYGYGTVTYSAYLKANGQNTVRLLLSGSSGQTYPGGGTVAYCNINLSTGAVSNVLAGTTATATNVGNGWWRLAYTCANNSTGNTSVRFDIGSGSPYTATGAESVFIWGIQSEVGSVATDFDPYPLGNTTDTNLGSPSFLATDYAEAGATGGLKGNGSSKYLQTGFPANTLDKSSRHLSVYEITRDPGTYKSMLGAHDDATGSYYYSLLNFNPGTTVAANFNAQAIATGQATGGHWIATDSTSNWLVLYKQGQLVASTNNTIRGTVTSTFGIPVFAVTSVPASGSVGNITSARLGAYSIGLGLDPTQAVAYYNAMQTFQTSLTRDRPSSDPMFASVTNEDAKLWIDNVYGQGGSVSASTAAAVNTFCNAIDAASLRDRFFRLNLFCGGTSGTTAGLNACLTPLYRGPSRTGTQYGNAIDTNASNLFVNGDYAENLGLTAPLSSSNYLDTGFTTAGLPAGVYESMHMSAWHGPIGAINTDPMLLGAFSTERKALQTSIRTAALAFETGRMGKTTTVLATNGLQGARPSTFLLTQRTSATSLQLYRNGVLENTTPTSVTGIGTIALPVFVFRNNNGGAAQGDMPGFAMRHYSIGDDMTEPQVLAFYNALAAFNTALGRTA
jgi:hypothetical protein